MGLFSDIYNTVAKFFRPQEEMEDASKSVATNRLKLVLMQDRTNLTPKILEQMRSELIDLLSRYVELDKELLDLNFEQEGNQVALMLSIPVIRAKDEDEIEAAIKAHQEAITKINEDAELSDSEEISAETENIDSIDIETNNESNITESSDDDDSERIEEIAKELQTPNKIIKKKVSTPEEMNCNVFKPDNSENTEKIESSTEA